MNFGECLRGDFVFLAAPPALGQSEEEATAAAPHGHFGVGSLGFSIWGGQFGVFHLGLAL